ncbi:GDSL esterase/lipase At4g01130 isoform X1 [Cryptomeria japonica]|uniref:GDSL esterase/lipase At4g01130 isoform X1 n=1 Tax=Cryptomeria japonica TaxID=3369 RepID=UPI0025AD5C36|nr:GDSL esterase/lipase At4g01130 isoform X1 [Cryptomeria japonica]
MERTVVIKLAVVVILVFCQVESSQGKCEYPAIFNFGDSNSDTGGFYAAFPSESPPYGMTFFHKPSGRASDGRLVVDFIAQAFGLPFLSPYLQSLGSDFRHGANYASDAGTVLQPNTSLYVTGISPFYLAVQFNQMKDFKVRALDLLSKGKHFDYLPTTDVFSKALYFLDIGQNDFTSQLGWIGIEGVKKFLPEVASQIGETVKELYALGARTIFVANLAPIGCFPAFLTELAHNNSDLDTYGCMISYNDAVLYYNNLLKEKLEEVRKVIPDASVVYVDSHAVKLEIYTNPKKHGFLYGTKACCGTGGEYNFNQQFFCSQKTKINGTDFTAPVCSDPSSYVSWDGIHNTEAANLYIAKEILSGKYFQPQFPLNTLCDLQPIG